MDANEAAGWASSFAPRFERLGKLLCMLLAAKRAETDEGSAFEGLNQRQFPDLGMLALSQAGGANEVLGLDSLWVATTFSAKTAAIGIAAHE